MPGKNASEFCTAVEHFSREVESLRITASNFSEVTSSLELTFFHTLSARDAVQSQLAGNGVAQENYVAFTCLLFFDKILKTVLELARLQQKLTQWYESRTPPPDAWWWKPQPRSKSHGGASITH